MLVMQENHVFSSHHEFFQLQWMFRLISLSATNLDLHYFYWKKMQMSVMNCCKTRSFYVTPEEVLGCPWWLHGGAAESKPENGLHKSGWILHRNNFFFSVTFSRKLIVTIFGQVTWLVDAKKAVLWNVPLWNIPLSRKKKHTSCLMRAQKDILSLFAIPVHTFWPYIC